MKMNHKEQWANQVLNSLDGIQRAKPDDALLSQIMDKLPATELTVTVSRWQLCWTAVAACLLIVINFYVFTADNNIRQANVAPETTSMRTEQTELTTNTSLFSDYSLY